MRRRDLLPVLACGAAWGAEPPPGPVRGILTADGGGTPALRLRDGSLVSLEGDAPTLGVLKDARLAGADFEAIGRLNSNGALAVGPIHTRSMFVHRDGKKLYITYWCELCAIRTYTPGVCQCCQEETALDLRENDDR